VIQLTNSIPGWRLFHANLHVFSSQTDFQLTTEPPEPELLYDCRFTASQFCLATSPFSLTTINIIFQLNTCFYGSYVTSCLTRGWVCNLQLLLALASTVILGSESRGTHDHILLPQIRDSSNQEGQVPMFISPRIRVFQLYPPASSSLLLVSYGSQNNHSARIE
jgi:hypothetical protein